MRKILGFGLLGVLVSFLALAVIVALYPVPEPHAAAVSEHSRITFADGTTVAEVGDVTRTSVPLSEVPEHAQLAMLAAEDRAFYEHRGVSPVALARAAVNNATGGDTQGGSTITQQYVKNAFLTHEQTLTRKVQEAILAVKLDLTSDKDTILAGYLNSIYYGRGAYGIEAAAQAYFGHPAAELTTAEGVALAGLVQSPGSFEPEEYPEALQGRFDYVVAGMVEQGWLSASEAADLTMPEFAPRDLGNKLGGQHGYVVAQARTELLAAGFTDAEIDGGGLRIVTTIDPEAQDALAQAVAEQGPQSNLDGVRIGAASVDPATGGILAMYGGPDYVTSSLNNATQATAQAGSTFKPFALAAAFEQGVSVYSRWNGDSPRTIAGYTLENEGNTNYGSVTLQRATERSINTPYVSLAHEVGIDNVMDAAFRAGVPQDTAGVNRDLTFVLGSASPTPLDMASAYATFAARGVFHEPYLVAEVTDGSGRTLYEATPEGEQRFDPEIADRVNDTLQRVITHGTATRGLAVGREVAGKTGTTDDNKSAWFVGYGPQVSTAVMLSKEDEAGNPVSLRGTGGLAKVFGSSFPLAIWTDYTGAYLADQPWAEFAPAYQPGSYGGYGTPRESDPYWSYRPSSRPAPRPAPVQPAPEVNLPAPVDPAPVDPAPVDPAPVDPAPVDPAPVDPAPVDPAPVDPAPVDPAPVDPAPVPGPVEPDPVAAPVDPMIGPAPGAEDALAVAPPDGAAALG